MNKQQIIAVILVGLGLMAGTFLVYQNQKAVTELESRKGLGSIIFKNGRSYGDVKVVDFVIATGDLESGREVPISSISVKVKIGEVNEDLSFVDDLQNPAFELIPAREYVDSEDWLFPVNTIFKDEGQYYLELVVVNINPGGYSTLAPERLGSIFVKSTSVKSPKVTLDKLNTKMMSKDKPVVDILP